MTQREDENEVKLKKYQNEKGFFEGLYSAVIFLLLFWSAFYFLFVH